MKVELSMKGRNTHKDVKRSAFKCAVRFQKWITRLPNVQMRFKGILSSKKGEYNCLAWQL